MAGKKPAWQRPELIVLARTKPEEAVLTGCKSTGYTAMGQGGGSCVLGGANGRCILNATS